MFSTTTTEYLFEALAAAKQARFAGAESETLYEAALSISENLRPRGTISTAATDRLGDPNFVRRLTRRLLRH